MIDILEEFEPTEVITILVDRKYKIKKELVEQSFEIPVLVIRNTGKAILVTEKGGSSWANGRKGEALWIPSFAMDKIGDRKYKVRYDKIDSKDFDKFIKRFGCEPLSESLNEDLIDRMFSEKEIHSKSPFKVVIKKGYRDYKTKKTVLRTYEFDGCIVAYTAKAVCISTAGSSFHASASAGRAFWIPLFVLNRRKDGNVLIYRPKVDTSDMLNFLKKNKIEYTEEPLNESLMSFTEFLGESKSDRLLSSVRSKINNEFSAKKFGIAFSSIPFNRIESILKKYDLMLTQEDGLPWEGILAGESGKTTIDVSRISNKTLLSNTQLVVSWYKLDSGRFEVTLYLS